MIQIVDPDLEAKLTSLGSRQLVPVKKAAMARAILRAAVHDDRGEPIDKWMEKVQKFDPADHEPEAA